MSALNQNYVSALRSFSSDKGNPQAYQAASGGTFNQLALSQLSFAAYVLFWINGGVQQVGGGFFTRQFLWGNLDDDNTNGWGIYLEPAAGQMVLTAACYATSGLRSSVVTLSDVDNSSFVERLILAGLWWDGANLTLSVNGSLMPSSQHATEAYQASAVNATLGADAAGDAPATNARIVSAGYAPQVVTTVTVGDLAGNHFKNCRESDLGGYLSNAAGVDWAHRYEAAQAVPAGTSGAVTKSASGVVQTAQPLAPVQLVDQGNHGPTPYAGVAATPLNRLGVLNLHLDQVAQPDWYDAPAFLFTDD